MLNRRKLPPSRSAVPTTRPCEGAKRDEVGGPASVPAIKPDTQADLHGKHSQAEALGQRARRGAPAKRVGRCCFSSDEHAVRLFFAQEEDVSRLGESSCSRIVGGVTQRSQCKAWQSLSRRRKGMHDGRSSLATE